MTWFVDEVAVRVEAGDGGKGCIAFHREKFVPRGGPSGGDGGDGGSVVIVAHERLRTLLDLRPVRVIRARAGEPGRGKQQCGARGPDKEVQVPVGTQVKDAGDGRLLADLTVHGARFVVARGGQGGRGNMRFASPTQRAPRRADPGEPGEARDLLLELKLMAEVGLLGFPNVGKSTFIRRVSGARPKVADYPFTTLEPKLGVCELPGERSLVIADLPGLVIGASEGVGLGHRFLRHLERTRVLLHLVDATLPDVPDPLAAFDALNAELTAYGDHLAGLGQVVALGKADLPEVREMASEVKAAFAARGIELHVISSATGSGIPSLLEELWRQVEAARGLAEPARSSTL
jgi:GTP-binding protein